MLKLKKLGDDIFFSPYSHFFISSLLIQNYISPLGQHLVKLAWLLILISFFIGVYEYLPSKAQGEGLLIDAPKILFLNQQIHMASIINMPAIPLLLKNSFLLLFLRIISFFFLRYVYLNVFLFLI